MTRTTFLCGLLAAVALTSPGYAQSPPPGVIPPREEPVQMVVDFGQGKKKLRVSHDGTFDPVTIPVGQQVTVTLRFLPRFAGSEARLMILDGGDVVLPLSPLIAADGSYVFQFRPGIVPGSYRFKVEALRPYEFTLYGVTPKNSPAPGGQ